MPWGKRRSSRQELPITSGPDLDRARLRLAVVVGCFRRHLVSMHRGQWRSGIQQQPGGLPRLQGDQYLREFTASAAGVAVAVATTHLAERYIRVGDDFRAQPDG